MKLITPDDPVNTGEDSGLEPEKLKSFAERLGFDVKELGTVVQMAGFAAVLRAIDAGGEITVPLTLCVVPAGKLPVFLNERTVRYVRECGEIADVDPDLWVDGWIGGMVDLGLNGQYDVTFGGITCDLVEEYGPAEQEGERTAEQKEALYDQLRGVAFRYQQEAPASTEGGGQ